MTAREQLLKEIAQAPDALIEEVLDFLFIVKTKHFQPSNLNKEGGYEKIARARGLLRDRQESLLSYAQQVRQEWE